MADPTADEIKAAYEAWESLQDFLDVQATVVGLWQAHAFSVSGDSLYYLDGDNDQMSIDIDEFLDPELYKRKKAERAEAQRLEYLRVQAQYEVRKVAEAREIIARYENRHPNEDIES